MRTPPPTNSIAGSSPANQPLACFVACLLFLPVCLFVVCPTEFVGELGELLEGLAELAEGHVAGGLKVGASEGEALLPSSYLHKHLRLPVRAAALRAEEDVRESEWKGLDEEARWQTWKAEDRMTATEDQEMREEQCPEARVNEERKKSPAPEDLLGLLGGLEEAMPGGGAGSHLALPQLLGQLSRNAFVKCPPAHRHRPRRLRSEGRGRRKEAHRLELGGRCRSKGGGAAIAKGSKRVVSCQGTKHVYQDLGAAGGLVRAEAEEGGGEVG